MQHADDERLDEGTAADARAQWARELGVEGELEGSLEDAILIATRVHRGKVDKAGQPYLLHPLRVMLRLEDDEARIVGVLHDVVEDSAWTLEDLAGAGFSEAVVGALDCLTRRRDESYSRYLERAAGNPLARRVKLADLEDNMDVRRLAEVGKEDAKRLAKYLKAWHRLKET